DRRRKLAQRRAEPEVGDVDPVLQVLPQEVLARVTVESLDRRDLVRCRRLPGLLPKILQEVLGRVAGDEPGNQEVQGDGSPGGERVEARPREEKPQRVRSAPWPLPGRGGEWLASR